MIDKNFDISLRYKILQILEKAVKNWVHKITTAKTQNR